MPSTGTKNEVDFSLNVIAAKGDTKPEKIGPMMNAEVLYSTKDQYKNKSSKLRNSSLVTDPP